MTTEKDYSIIHVLNNNSIIVDGYLTESILIGKGIGFGKKPGDVLPQGQQFDKIYKLANEANEFRRIINGYDENIVVMVMDTIQHMMRRNASEFSTHDLVTIADHLAAMFLRIREGDAIVSFFSNETKTLYPQSFSKAEEIAAIIYEEYDVIIPEAEIAYIGLYIENMSSSKSKRDVEQMAAIIEEIREFIEEQNKLIIDKESLAYSRFLIHIRLLAQSASFSKTTLDSVINKAILSTYPEYKVIAEGILDIIRNETKRSLNDSELVYLIIHLVNLFEKRSK